MAYETGTSTNITDLLDKLRLFAIANGWSVNRWITAGNGKELCIQKGTSYFNFRSYFNETVIVNGFSAASKHGLALNGSDGYNSGSTWDKQPGYPLRGATTNGDQGHCYLPLVINTGPFPTYYFFAPNANTIYVELEVSTGVFLRFGCGSLDLFNVAAPGGGRFCYATTGDPSVTNGALSSDWLGVDADTSAYTCEMVPFRAADIQVNDYPRLRGSMLLCAYSAFDNWAGSGRTVYSGWMRMACQGGGIHDKTLREYSPNPMNGTGLILPNIVSLNISDASLMPVGVMPGFRHLDISNYLPGDEFSLGSDTWKIFPMYQKGGIGYNRGVAYLKV